MGCTILVFRNLKYYIKSAASSFVRNGIMTVASFITVTCALFLFGVFLLVTLNLNDISRQIESQCEIQAYIYMTADDATEQSICAEISKTPNIEKIEFESKEQAFTNFKKKLGNKSYILDGLEGQEFLRSSVKITLKDINLTQDTVKAVRKIDGVEEVKHHQDLVDKVIMFTDVVKRGSIIAMLILLIIAVFIIKNTIKLSVYAREKEIHIMKFVGATDHFIRMPFVYEGVMIGILGFIVSFLIIAFGYGAVISTVSNMISLFEFIPLQKCVLVLGVSMAAFGVIMGAAGSGLSIKKHLKV